MKNKNILKISYQRNNIIINEEFSDIKTLNNYVLNLYFEGKIKRRDAVSITGLSPIALSTSLHRHRNKKGNDGNKK